LLVLLGLGVATATAGERAKTTISFGIADDAAKYAEDGGDFYFRTMADLGMVENRVTVYWDETEPTTLQEQAFFDRVLPTAARNGIRMVLAVQALHARAFTVDTENRIDAFAAYVRRLALRYPGVRTFAIGNEPNQKRFLQPQHSPNGAIVSAAMYARIMAAVYDALKDVDPSIEVAGLTTAPGGNDGKFGVGNESVSPVRFIVALGQAYRKSGRTKPLMDSVDVHVYSARNVLPLTQPRKWPQAGPADLDRLKQAWWDAFAGTAQPLFQEAGRSKAAGTRFVRFRLDESGTQVQIDPTKVDQKLYKGRENVPLVTEAQQAQFYGEVIGLVKCDPDVETFNLFHLIDEIQLLGFQSGLLRADGSRRPSYATVRKAIASAGTCPKLHSWRHTTSVVGAKASFTLRDKPRKQRVFWAKVTTGEEATATGGIYPADPAAPGRAEVKRSLLDGGADAVLTDGGKVRANSSRQLRFRGTLEPGRYIFGVLMKSTMNPSRTKLLLSNPFTVR
jgi:hypothetical protein